MEIPQLFDPVLGYFEQLLELLDETVFPEEQVVVEREPGVPFVLVGIDLAKQFPVHPLVKIQHLLPDLEYFLSQHGVLLSQLPHFSLAAFQQKSVLGLLSLGRLLFGQIHCFEHFE